MWDTHGYSTQFAGEIKELDVSQYVNKKMARRLDDCIKYTIVAGKKVTESELMCVPAVVAKGTMTGPHALALH